MSMFNSETYVGTFKQTICRRLAKGQYSEQRNIGPHMKNLPTTDLWPKDLGFQSSGKSDQHFERIYSLGETNLTDSDYHRCALANSRCCRWRTVRHSGERLNLHRLKFWRTSSAWGLAPHNEQ
ncbi:hypothetical protein Tcan_01095, partial [Toxocara canis]